MLDRLQDGTTAPRAIIQILRSPLGGIGKHVRDLACHLSSDSKVETIIVTDLTDANFHPPLPPEIQVINLPISDAPRLMNDLKNILFIYRKIKTHRVSIIHGHGAKGGLYARSLKVFFNFKCIYTPHGGSLHRSHGYIKNFVFDLVEKFLSTHTDLFIFESNYSKTMFEKNVRHLSNFSVNPNGVDVPPNPGDYSYNPGDVLRIKSFGLLRHLKGHDIAIETCKLLRKKNVNFRYTIFGKGEERESLLQLITTYQLDEWVKIQPYTDNVESELCTSDSVLHPSRHESFGYVPLEAMAQKIPVVTSGAGGLGEVVTKDSGYICPSNSPEEYADVFERIFRGLLSPANIAECGYLRAKSLFSKDKMLRSLDEMYAK